MAAQFSDKMLIDDLLCLNPVLSVNSPSTIPSIEIGPDYLLENSTDADIMMLEAICGLEPTVAQNTEAALLTAAQNTEAALSTAAQESAALECTEIWEDLGDLPGIPPDIMNPTITYEKRVYVDSLDVEFLGVTGPRFNINAAEERRLFKPCCRKCFMTPSHGPTEYLPLRCATHKTDADVKCTIHRCRCLFPKCDKLPIYGYSEKDWAQMLGNRFERTSTESEVILVTRCQYHKLWDMIPFPRMICQMCNVSRYPPSIATHITSENYILCEFHASGLANTRPIPELRCCFIRCTKQPIFGFFKGCPRTCKDHRILGMCDIQRTKCWVPNCANFSLTPEFSKKIRIVDGHKICEHHYYSKEYKSRLFLFRSCKITGCTTRPTYGRYVAEYCDVHSGGRPMCDGAYYCNNCKERVEYTHSSTICTPRP